MFRFTLVAIAGIMAAMLFAPAPARALGSGKCDVPASGVLTFSYDPVSSSDTIATGTVSITCRDGDTYHIALANPVPGVMHLNGGATDPLSYTVSVVPTNVDPNTNDTATFEVQVLIPKRQPVHAGHYISNAITLPISWTKN